MIANLIGIHVILGIILILSFILRKILLHGGVARPLDEHRSSTEWARRPIAASAP